MTNSANTDYTSYLVAGLVCLICYTLGEIFGKVVFTDKNVFSFFSSLSLLAPILSLVLLLATKIPPVRVLLAVGPAWLFLPSVGMTMFIVSFLKLDKRLKWLGIVASIGLSVLVTPFSILDFTCGSSYRLLSEKVIGNKFVAEYHNYSFRSKHESSNLKLETPVLPGIRLSKEIYSQDGPDEIEFRIIDDHHFEFDTDYGTTRTVAI